MSSDQVSRDGASSPVSPSKKLQRSVHNQTSPNLKNCRSLKLRRIDLTNPQTKHGVIQQCGSQANYITHLDISYSITESTTLQFLCSKLGHIRTLIAVECKLTHIEEETQWPLSLQTIDLSRNRLTTLPSTLNTLFELKELNVSGNLIKELNPSLLLLPKLQKIHLVNNPIQNVPKTICRDGVHKLRQFFKVTPLCLPTQDRKPEHRDKQLDLRRYALHNQGSIDSGYESTPRTLSGSSSTYCTSDEESVDNSEEEWPQFWRDSLPEGYTEAVASNLCQVYLPEGYDVEIKIDIVKDISLHPQIQANELLITPVVQVSPHGTVFPENQPAIIVLSHCTKPSTSTPLNIVPLCSNTGIDQYPHWEPISSTEAPQIFKDCVVFSTTHFSLFSVVASTPYPSKSIVLSPDTDSILKMQELDGFRIELPRNSLSTPTRIKSTLYYADSPYAIESPHVSLASACIGVEPHGMQFNSSVRVSVPIPHFQEIREVFPDAVLQLYHAATSDTENGHLQWEPAEQHHYETLIEHERTIARFETTHFSLFEFLWNVGRDTLQKFGLGAASAYRHLSSRARFVSVRWQVFMTPPLSDLSCGLAVCIYKFGEPLKELSNYPWLVGDSGSKGVFLRVGELKVTLEGHFSPSQDVNETLERNTTVVDFQGEDFCVRFDFALKLSDALTPPLQDGQLLGKLQFTQMNGERPVVTSYNLIKPTDTRTSPVRSITPQFQPNLDSLTPPWSPDTDVQMDCDDVFNNHPPKSAPLTTPSNPYVQPLPNSRKHQREDSFSSSDTSLLGSPSTKSKRRLFLRIDHISDKTLLDVSQAACSKYVDIGIRLGLPYNVIESTVGGVGTSKPEHLKMFHVLQEWKGRAAEEFTFEVLSKALEEVGLSSVAQNYCYDSV